MVKLQSHSTSNPSSIAQKAAVEALKGPQESVQLMLAEYRRRRDFVIEKLRDIPEVSCTMPGGAFYAYPNVSAFIDSPAHPGPRSNSAPSANELAKKLLREAGVAVVPGEAFGTQHHFRISYATSMNKLAEGLGRLKHFFSQGGN
jgi:aspartate aminotransferase